MGNAFESIHFFQKMSYLIFFENPAFKIFHLSTHCGGPKSVATPEDLKYGARLCPYSSLPTVCSLIISENYKDSIKILSVLPFYPFPWEGRSSGSSQCAAPQSGWCSWSWCFPVAAAPSAVPECAPSHTPATCSYFRSCGCSEVKKTDFKVPIWVTLEDYGRVYFSQFLFPLNLLSPVPFPLLFRRCFCPKDALLPLVIMAAEWWTHWEYITSLSLCERRQE